MIIKVKVKDIRPNPYQPESRLSVPQETAEKFAKSILEHGLLQTPVGRFIKGPGEHYEIGDGWLRLSGFRYLEAHNHPEYSEMPLDVREFSDQQMADMILEANRMHKDLTPIDRAHFFRKYLKDFKVTQEELAKIHKITQGEVANTMRLLDLPENIQRFVISQEISETHALKLVALKDWPGLLEELVKKVIATKMSTAVLEEEVRQITNKQKRPRKTEPARVPAPSPPAAKTEPVQPLPKVTEESGPKPAKTEETPPKTSKVEEIKKSVTAAPAAAAPKWKRKLALEETDKGVQVSLMSEKGFLVKTLVGNLETTLEQLPAILAEANKQWEGK